MKEKQLKTAYEIAMERLRKQDAERGETQPLLSPRQKDEIAEIRRVYQARQAEREILHKAELRKVQASRDAEAVRTVEESYSRDRARLEEEMESKINAVRQRDR